MIQSVTLRSPILRSASSNNKQTCQLYDCYGTSSKQAPSNLDTSKVNVLNTLKSIVDYFFPSIWKSISQTSLIGNVGSHISKVNSSPKKLESIKTLVKSKDNNHQTNNFSSNKPTDLIKQSNTVISDEVEVKEKNAINLQKLNPTSNANSQLEQNFFDWLTKSDFYSKRKEFLGKNVQHAEKSKKAIFTKTSLQQRSRFLVSSLSEATSTASQFLRLEEVCKHLLLYPDQKSVMCKAGLVRIALGLRYNQTDEAVQSQSRSVLALIGCPDPPKGKGIRILSIDGGGTRGILAIEILRHLEKKTNKKVYELFDIFCGVSSGAVLGLLLGGLRMSLDECESLYRRLSDEIFNQSSFWGTSRLMWSHAYYDTTMWVDALKKTFGERLLIDTIKEHNSPKLAVVSAIINLPHLHPFVFRNYDFPPGVQSYYRGSCKYRMWESIRASGAAPGYFEEYCLDDYLHQDGGIMINNPTALAIHEAKLLWPSDNIQCVMSLGTGRYIPAVSPNLKSTSLKTKVLKIIDSATDTEAVHVILNDLLSPNTYFRMNPYLTEFLTLDENRTEKLDQMKSDAQMYVRRNEYKFRKGAQNLIQPRSYYKITQDWLSVQKKLYF